MWNQFIEGLKNWNIIFLSILIVGFLIFIFYYFKESLSLNIVKKLKASLDNKKDIHIDLLISNKRSELIKLFGIIIIGVSNVYFFIKISNINFINKLWYLLSGFAIILISFFIIFAILFMVLKYSRYKLLAIGKEENKK